MLTRRLEEMKDLVWEGRDYGIIGNSLKRRNCCQEDGCRVPQEQDYLCYCKYGMDLNGPDPLIVERGSFYSWIYIYHGFPSLLFIYPLLGIKIHSFPRKHLA